jgi:hypothetical protein
MGPDHATDVRFVRAPDESRHPRDDLVPAALSAQR